MLRVMLPNRVSRYGLVCLTAHVGRHRHVSPVYFWPCAMSQHVKSCKLTAQSYAS